MATWATEYLQMISDCEARESRLSEWEVEFIDSLSNQLAQEKIPSPKQVKILEEIWEKATVNK